MLHTSERACFIVIYIHIQQSCALAMSYSRGLHHDTGELNHTLVIQITNYVDWLGASSKFVQNSTKLTCLESTVYQTKHSSVMTSRTSNQAWLKCLDTDTYFK
jgi:hypothetical protein